MKNKERNIWVSVTFGLVVVLIFVGGKTLEFERDRDHQARMVQIKQDAIDGYKLSADAAIGYGEAAVKIANELKAELAVCQQ